MKVDLSEVRKIVNQAKTESLQEGDMLVNILHCVQDHFGNFIPPEAAEIVAQELDIPLSKVYIDGEMKKAVLEESVLSKEIVMTKMVVRIMRKLQKPLITMIQKKITALMIRFL